MSEGAGGRKRHPPVTPLAFRTEAPLLSTTTCAIVVDSTTDLAPSECAELHSNMRVVPVMVRLGGEALQDYVEIGPQEFYDRLASTDEHPEMSAPTPDRFADAYRELFLAGYEQIVSLHPSEHLSNAVRSAAAGAEQWPSRVHVIDTRSFSTPAAILALDLAAQIASGTTVTEVRAAVKKHYEVSRTIVVPASLEYPRRAGWVTANGGRLGSLVGKQSMLELRDGRMHQLERLRGAGKLLGQLAQRLDREAPHRGTIRIGIAHAAAPDLAREIREMVLEIRPDAWITRVTAFGAGTGSLVGPGTVAVTWSTI